MKTFERIETFEVRQALPRDVPTSPEGPTTLFTDEDGAAIEAALLERLEQMPPGSLLVIDLSGIRVASAAARRILRRALLRVTGGELADRFLAVTGMSETRYSVKVMLESEGLTLVERPAEGGPARLLGKIDPAVEETYGFVSGVPRATAHDVMKQFEQRTISAATNRLTRLASLGLARRVDQEIIEGGGRQYVYAAVR